MHVRIETSCFVFRQKIFSVSECTIYDWFYISVRSQRIIPYPFPPKELWQYVFCWSKLLPKHRLKFSSNFVLLLYLRFYFTQVGSSTRIISLHYLSNLIYSTRSPYIFFDDLHPLFLWPHPKISFYSYITCLHLTMSFLFLRHHIQTILIYSLSFANNVLITLTNCFLNIYF